MNIMGPQDSISLKTLWGILREFFIPLAKYWTDLFHFFRTTAAKVHGMWSDGNAIVQWEALTQLPLAIRKAYPELFNINEGRAGSLQQAYIRHHLRPCACLTFWSSGHPWVNHIVTGGIHHVTPWHPNSVTAPFLLASRWLGPSGSPSPPLDLHWMGGRWPTWRKGRRPWTGGRLGLSGFGVGPHAARPTSATGHHGHGRPASSVATSPPPAVAQSRAVSD